MPKVLNRDPAQTSFQAYMARARKIPLLTAAEEVELAIIAKSGGPGALAARNKLVDANLRFVVSVAWKQVRPTIPLEDLVQEGNMGLIRAVEKFDETLGYRFVTYARWWVRQALGKYLDENGFAFKLPARSAQRIGQMNRSISKLSYNGLPPSDEEVAADMGVDVEVVRSLAEYALHPVSMQTPIREGEASEIGELLVDEKAVNPEEAAMGVDLEDKVHSALGTLKERERDIVERRFGLNGHNEHTLDDLGKMYGVTRERIRQIEAKALIAMRKGATGRVLQNLL